MPVLPSLRRSVPLLMLAGLALLALRQPAAAQDIRIVTEELPPYNMTQGGQVTGLATEVVLAVLKEAGLPAAPIQVMPWARAYDTALNGENVLIYSITRTPQREKLFKWVGLIAPTQSWLFALNGRVPALKSLEDARKYQIATVNGDAGEQYLTARGFVIGMNLQSSTRYELNYEKLKGGRVDLWVSNELHAGYVVRQAGDDPAVTVQRVLPLSDLSSEGGVDMAFSLKTPDAVVERARKALETLRKNGTYESLQKKWL